MAFDLLPTTMTIEHTSILEIPVDTYRMLSGKPIEDDLFGKHGFQSEQEFLKLIARNPGRSLLGVCSDTTLRANIENAANRSAFFQLEAETAQEECKTKNKEIKTHEDLVEQYRTTYKNDKYKFELAEKQMELSKKTLGDAEQKLKELKQTANDKAIKQGHHKHCERVADYLRNIIPYILDLHTTFEGRKKLPLATMRTTQELATTLGYVDYKTSIKRMNQHQLVGLSRLLNVLGFIYSKAYYDLYGNDEQIVLTTGRHHNREDCRIKICELFGFHYPGKDKTPEAQSKVKPVKVKTSVKHPRPSTTSNKDLIRGVESVTEEATVAETMCGKMSQGGLIQFLLKRKELGILGTNQGLADTDVAAAAAAVAAFAASGNDGSSSSRPAS